MSKNCKNCLHHRKGVGCESGIRCIDFDLYKEIINPVHEEREYYICFNKKCEQYQWKSCSCSLGIGANSCGARIKEEVIEKEVEKGIPSSLIKTGIIEVEKEMVNHPTHYNKGNIEVIDYIEDKNLNFNLGNAIKYISRCEEKGNKEEDIKKAIWYLNRELGRK